MDFLSRPTRNISGTIRVPGDKSISHRALLLGSLADGPTNITGFLAGADCHATLTALEALGVRIERIDDTSLCVHGQGMHGLRAPGAALDLGNSGTAMRLFCGVLAAQTFDSELVGDESLSRRPMDRVAEPLRRMGAVIETRGGRPPLRIRGGQKLRGIEYRMPVASAQVKSALLLAGLYAHGTTRVVEPGTTRDHTERMLSSLGYRVERDAHVISLTGGGHLRGARIDVPGDLSSAAFFVVAACLAEQGELVVEHVGLNPTRTGILDILKLMNADITIETGPVGDGEACGRIIARPSRLRGAHIPPELVPLAIDEFPLVFVAAALAEGDTVIAGAEELRHKESDRISVMTQGLRSLNARVEERADGVTVSGGTLAGGEVDSAGDHRVAMAFAVAAVGASDPIRIRNTENVATSFPDFVGCARAVGLNASESRDD